MMLKMGVPVGGAGRKYFQGGVPRRGCTEGIKEARFWGSLDFWPLPFRPQAPRAAPLGGPPLGVPLGGPPPPPPRGGGGWGGYPPPLKRGKIDPENVPASFTDLVFRSKTALLGGV